MFEIDEDFVYKLTKAELIFLFFWRCAGFELNGDVFFSLFRIPLVERLKYDITELKVFKL